VRVPGSDERSLAALARGAKLALLGRTLEKLEAVAGEAQGEAICASVDVAVRSQVERRSARRRTGLGPFILVANAGIGGPNDLGGAIAGTRSCTNLDGAYFCIRAFEARWRRARIPGTSW
jgi:NAD(P)-dependent dehydrogenase (short-subunit alcohol dehydrogenase family)